MKRAILILTLAMIFVGCNGSKHPKPTPQANVTIKGSSELLIGSIGGEDLSINCHTSGGNESTTLSAKSDCDWIEIVACDNSCVKYNVLRNESDNQREGAITIGYGNSTASYSVTQKEYADLELNALMLNGSCYYGETAENSGLYNYYIVLSTAGISESGELYADNTYCFLDLYSTTPVSNPERWNIPQGTYTMEDGTVGGEYSYYATTDSSSAHETLFTSASVNVSSEGIDARLTLATGESVNVWYRGSITVNTNSDNALSTLQSNYTFNIEGATFVGAFDQDNYHYGCKVCNLYIFEHLDSNGNYEGDVYQLTLLLSHEDNDIAGSYRRGTSHDSFILGSANINENGSMELCDSWYTKADYSVIAPITSGEITIEQDDNGGYLFMINVNDDANHIIRGTIRAEGTIF